MRILLAEDDPQLGEGIRLALQHTGYTVDWFRGGVEARNALVDDGYDLLLLDLGLPHKDGLTLLKELRDEGGVIPVLILTARDSVADRVEGLDLGADDYMAKPFDLDELCARIRALMRRNAGRVTSLIKHGGVELDPVSHSVALNGDFISIPAKEFAILHFLLENKGKVFSREQIEKRLYGWNDSVESNSIEVHIHYLRKKLGKKFISTIRSVGYMVPKIP